MKAKKVYEAVEDVFKPKSEEELETIYQDKYGVSYRILQTIKQNRSAKIEMVGNMEKIHDSLRQLSKNNRNIYLEDFNQFVGKKYKQVFPKMPSPGGARILLKNFYARLERIKADKYFSPKQKTTDFRAMLYDFLHLEDWQFLAKVQINTKGNITGYEG